MSTMNLLTETDIRLVAFHYNEWKDVDTDDLSEREARTWLTNYWSKRKEWLAEVFGGELILSKPFVATRGIEELKDSLYQLIELGGFCEQLIENFTGNLQTEDSPIIETLFKKAFLSMDVFLAGVVETSFLKELQSALQELGYEIEDYIPKNIKGGMKISKALKLLDELHKGEFSAFPYEGFRIDYSQAMNQKDIKGELCLSIHPMDYLTMSDNTYDWGSCMSWSNNGCRSYRSGTISVMESPYVVVAYLKGKEEMEYRDWRGNLCFNWNSKKWRELFYVTPDMVVANTQYPYRNGSLETEAFNWLVSLVELAENKPFTKEPTVIGVDHIEKKTPISGTATTITKRYNGDMYSDFVTHNSLHPTRHTTEWLDGECREITFDYARRGHCPYCGQVGLIEEIVCCASCNPEGEEFCAGGCGASSDYEPLHEGADGDSYCSECWDEKFVTCNISGDVVSRFFGASFCILPPVTISPAHYSHRRIHPPAYYDSAYFDEISSKVQLVPVETDDAEAVFVGEYVNHADVYRLSDAACTDTSIDINDILRNTLYMRSCDEWKREDFDLKVWDEV